MNKSKIFKKLVNYKLLYTLPAVGVGLCFTSQTANAMFKSSLEFFRKLESSSSGISSFPTRPLTSSTLTTGGASISSKISKLPVQTSYSLGDRHKVSPSTNKDPSSLSFADKLKFFSSMSTQPASSISKQASSSSSKSASKDDSDSQKIDISKTSASNLGNFVKNNVRSHLLTEFNSKMDTSARADPSNNEILNKLMKEVYSLSTQTFSTAAHSQLSDRNIAINSKIQKNIESSAEKFAESMANLVTTNFKQGIDHFNNSIKLGNFDSIDSVKTALRVSRSSSEGLDILTTKYLTSSLRAFMKLYE